MSYTQSYVVNSSSAQGTTDFQFTFPYIKEAHIEVYLDYTKLTQGTGSNQYAVITNVSPKLIRLNTGTTSANMRVEVRRNSSLGTPLVDYADGSTLTANDLDTSALQSLYIDQELKDNQTKTVSVDESTGLPSLGESGTNLRLTKVADPTSAQDAVTKAYLERAGSISSTQILDGTILNADVNASAAIAGSKLQASSSSNAGSMSAADKAKLDAIEASATADQTNAEIRAAVEAASDSNVFTDADHSKLNAIEASATADQTDAEIRAAVEAATDSNVFTDADHTKLNAIEANATADQTDAEIRAAVEAATDSNVFTDADHTKLNGIETAATADQTAAEIKTAYESNSNTNALTDNEKAVIDGVTANTSELNKLDGATATTAELNIVAGKTFRASGDGTLTTTSDTEIPSSKVIASHVSSAVGNVGGFTVIANDASFPATASQPANGIVVSINDAAGVVVNGSGTSTTGRTTDGTPATVTINGFPSSLNGETLASGVGMQVVSTGSSNTYNYHKILASENDVKALSDDINDFNARYRVASSAPSSNNDDGDLYFDTSANKMKVYNATTSAWDDVASVGNFYINTISSSSGTGGGSATFNGSAYRFTLSNPPTMAQQLIVSVNGVTQKPNTGTSQPGEGFAVDGNDIVFSSAPASGSDFFIITQGSSVSIGTPSDNTVTTGKIVDGSITNAKVSNSAAIAGSKLADDSIAEAKLDIHQAPADGKYLKYTSSNGMEWGDVTSLTANSVDEAKLEVDNSPTNDHVLTAKSSASGGLTWAPLPAGSGTFTAVADGALADGDPVVIQNDGKVKKITANNDTLATPSTYSGTTYSLNWSNIVAIGNNQVVATWYKSADSNSYAVVGTINANNTITWGTPVLAVNAAYDVSLEDLCVVGDGTPALLPNKFLMTYVLGSDDEQKVKMGTVSGTGSSATISWSSTTNPAGGGTQMSSYVMYVPDAGVHLTAFNQKSAGNSVDTGFNVMLNRDPDAATPSFSDRVRVSSWYFHHLTAVPVGNKQVCILFNSSSTQTIGGDLSARILNIPDSGGVTDGSIVQVSDYTTGFHEVFWDDTLEQLTFIYKHATNNKMMARKATISGSTISLVGAEQVMSVATRNFYRGKCGLYNKFNRKYYVTYEDVDDSDDGKMVEFEMTTEPQNVSTPFEINVQSGSTEPYGTNDRLGAAMCLQEDTKKLVMVWPAGIDSGSGSPGGYRVFHPKGTNLTDSNFLGYADAAYSDAANATIQITGSVNDTQSDLAVGKKYYFKNDGSLTQSTAEVPSVFAGQAIAATKVKIP